MIGNFFETIGNIIFGFIVFILKPFLLVFVFFFILSGNNAFEEDLSKAAKSYLSAAKFPISERAIALYNAGSAHYKLKKYDDAKKNFTEALGTATENQQALIYYNLGNTEYRLGEQLIKTDVPKVIELWESAIKQYEEALKINPNDKEAQENIDFIKKRLAERKKQSGKEQEKSDKNESQEQQEDESVESEKERIQENEQKEKQNFQNHKKYSREKKGAPDRSKPYW